LNPNIFNTLLENLNGNIDNLDFSNDTFFIKESRSKKIPSYILKQKSYEKTKKIIKSKWKSEKMLELFTNSCQLQENPTLDELTLTRSAISITFGLNLINKNVLIDDNIKGTCIKMLHPNNIIGKDEIEFEIKLKDSQELVNVDYHKITPFLDKYVELDILEVMYGNGYATNIVIQILIQKGIKVNNYVATDIIDYTTRKDLDLPNINFKFDKLDTIDAIEKYSETSNTLLIISPPPSLSVSTLKEMMENEYEFGYADFYACHEFIKSKKNSKNDNYIIIIGELGASDGTEGIYHYLMNNKEIKLIHENVVSKTSDIIFGAIIKSIYVFKLNNS